MTTNAKMAQISESFEAGKAKFQTSAKPENTTSETTNRSCDILLNNFQIKKKRYRVLLNYDHIVWERWDATQKDNPANEKFNNARKETGYENEHLSDKAQYGSNSNTVHINEIIRVEKGDTKSASLRVEIQQTSLRNPTADPNYPNDIGAITPSAQYLTIHYAERIVKSPTDCNRWRIRSLTLYNADPYIVAQWHMLLRQKLYAISNRLHIRRLLVFINPYGGRKEGLRTYEQHCKPIFQLAGIDASCVVSQRQNQIRDIIMSHDLTPYDAICSVGGDGTAAEVINGLIFRAMHDHGIESVPQPAYIPKPPLPIGIIPAGSTDTIAYSAHGTADPRTAAIHVILGQRRGCDICSIRNRQGIVRFCASVFSYGYLGDVAAHSEKYRWMGPKRYEYTGVKAFLANRGYEAEISIMETQDDVNNVEARTSRSTLGVDSVCYANCQRCSSVISNNFKVDNLHDIEQNIDNEPLQRTSNWTLCTEKSFEHYSDAERSSGGGGAAAAGNTSDAVDRTSYKTADIEQELEKSNDMTNCDKNLQSDLDEKYQNLKVLVKCDKPELGNVENNVEAKTQIKADSTTNVSQNSFSFCSTSSTSKNQKKFQVGSVSNSDNEMAPTLVPTSPSPSPLPKWKTIRGEFFMVSCANITCACARSPNGISRYNHLGDGHLDLILVKKTSMFNNIRFALNTMGRNGDIRNLPFVEILRTRQLRFRAQFSNDDTNRGSTQPIASAFTDNIADKLVSSWNCDGEVLHDLEVTITSHCQLIDVFMRGPYSYTKSNNVEESNFCCCSKRN